MAVLKRGLPIRGRIDHVRRDPHAIAYAQHRSFKYGIDVKLSANLRQRLLVFPLVLHHGSSRNHSKRPNSGEFGDQCLRHVAHDAAFARVASIRLGLALFPVPAHRTEQARFTHSALGESVTRSPTESWSSAY
jgi:hypothetical protein